MPDPIIQHPSGAVAFAALATGASGDVIKPVTPGNPLPTIDRSYTQATVLVADTLAPAGGAVLIDCATEGHIKFELASGVQLRFAVPSGLVVLPLAVQRFLTDTTTAVVHRLGAQLMAALVMPAPACAELVERASAGSGRTQGDGDPAGGDVGREPHAQELPGPCRLLGGQCRHARQFAAPRAGGVLGGAAVGRAVRARQRQHGHCHERRLARSRPRLADVAAPRRPGHRALRAGWRKRARRQHAGAGRWRVRLPDPADAMPAASTSSSTSARPAAAAST